MVLTQRCHNSTLIATAGDRPRGEDMTLPLTIYFHYITFCFTFTHFLLLLCKDVMDLSWLCDVSSAEISAVEISDDKTITIGSSLKNKP